LIRFFLYLGRWQLSTPILWLVVSNLGAGLGATVVANLVGASIFFWVDRLIFRAKQVAEWETENGGSCVDCGRQGLVRRLTLAPSGGASGGQWYDKRFDPEPEYRCISCSVSKLKRLAETGRIAHGLPSIQVPTAAR
jgi:hypothetical protein